MTPNEAIRQEMNTIQIRSARSYERAALTYLGLAVRSADEAQYEVAKRQRADAMELMRAAMSCIEQIA